MTDRHSPLIDQFVTVVEKCCRNQPALDLACGQGRNGLALLRRGIAVTFADLKLDALDVVSQKLEQPEHKPYQSLASLWSVDLEQTGSSPLADKQFGAILVFRYLHRPLLEQIRQAISPGGLLIYETFTVDQVHYGRPTNPDFLLRPGELSQRFADWEVLHYFEGLEVMEEQDKRRAVAQIVVRKPATAG